MARVSITKTTAPGSNPTAGALITWTDADASNKNSFVMNGNDLLLVRNAHATDAKTVTLNTVADAQGRTKDITAESLAAGVVRIFGPFRDMVGWAQTSGVMHLEGSTSDIKFAVVALPQNE